MEIQANILMWDPEVLIYHFPRRLGFCSSEAANLGRCRRKVGKQRGKDQARGTEREEEAGYREELHTT